MTRTQLLYLAIRVIEESQYQDDVQGLGTIYISEFNGKTISVCRGKSNTILALAYDKVCYFINPCDLRTAQKLRAFVADNSVTTRVFLYPKARALFVDEDGPMDDRTVMAISRESDYRDVIPFSL